MQDFFWPLFCVLEAMYRALLEIRESFDSVTVVKVAAGMGTYALVKK